MDEIRTSWSRLVPDNSMEDIKPPKIALTERLSTLLDFEEPEKGQFLRIITNNFGPHERELLKTHGFVVVEVNNTADLVNKEITQIFVRAQNISEQDLKGREKTTPIFKIAIVIPPNIRDSALSENEQFRDLWMITKQYGHIIDDRF